MLNEDELIEESEFQFIKSYFLQDFDKLYSSLEDFQMNIGYYNIPILIKSQLQYFQLQKLSMRKFYSNVINFIFYLLLISFLIYIIANIVIILLSVKSLLRSNDIFNLFSKIRQEHINFYCQYYQAFVKRIKNNQNDKLLNIFEQQSRKLNKLEEFRQLKTYRFNYNFKQLIKWVLLYLLCIVFILILFILWYFFIQAQLVQIYNQYFYLQSIQQYNQEVMFSNWLITVKLNQLQQNKQQTYDLSQINSYYETINENLQQYYLLNQFSNSFIHDIQFQEIYQRLMLQDNCLTIQNSQFNCTNKIITMISKSGYRGIYAYINIVQQIYYKLFRDKVSFDEIIQRYQQEVNQFFHLSLISLQNHELIQILIKAIQSSQQNINSYLQSVQLVFFIASIILLFAGMVIFKQFLYKYLKQYSIENSKFIKIVPFDLIINNQYFKVYLNKNKI